MTKILEAKYEGAGFVEALIAIMVVGIASVVLLQIAVTATQDMIQNETIDIMTQDAVEGSTMIQSIATQGGTNTFPTDNGCYIINTNVSNASNQYSFATNPDGSFVKYTLDDGTNPASNDRDIYKKTAVLPTDDRFFRVFCLDGYTMGDKFAIIKIVVGQTNSNGTITKGNNVKDYAYYTVVKL
jgi:type II secretory pathway pseudopilin PulG